MADKDDPIARIQRLQLGGKPAQQPAATAAPEAGSAAGRTMRFIDSIGRQLAKGATFGGADEFAAAADAGVGHLVGRGSQAGSYGERYGENLTTERKRDADFQTEYPILSAAARGAGNVGGILAIAQAAPATVGRWLFGGGSRALQAARGAGTGGAAAGATAFGEGEGGFDNRAAAAVRAAPIGAALGGAVGALLPAGRVAAGQIADDGAAAALARRATDEIPPPAGGAPPALPPPGAPPALPAPGGNLPVPAAGAGGRPPVPPQPPATPPTAMPQTPGGGVPPQLMPGQTGRALAAGAGAGAGSEAAGQATEGTPLEFPARIAGALAGGTAASVSGAGARRPTSTDPMRQRYVETLEGEGIPLTPAQRSGNVRDAYRESWFETQPITGRLQAGRSEAQQRAFNEAALKRAGIRGDQATPEALGGALRNVRSAMDMLERNTVVRPDQRFQQQIIDGMARYADQPFEHIRKGMVGFLEDVGTGAGVGGVSGAQGGQWVRGARERLRAWEMSDDANVREASRIVRHALDDLVERSLPEGAQGMWSEARRLYMNLKTVEDARNANVGGYGGDIQPAAYARAVKKRDPEGFATGRSGNAELGNAAASILRTQPQSGTQPRLSNDIAGLYGAGGMGIGALLGEPMVGLGAGLAYRYANPLLRYGAHYYGPQFDAAAAQAGIAGSAPTTVPPMVMPGSLYPWSR